MFQKIGNSIDIDKRLNKHNSNKGAKSTKGYKWKLIYKKKFYSKSKAMSFEYKLKKDRSMRLIIIAIYSTAMNLIKI